MICDDYVNYIAQKYTLAISVAVIKTKPENKTLEQHIDDIKLNINEENMNTDIDITVCSDDFDFNDDDETMNEIDDANNNDISRDSVTILKDFNDDIGNIDGNNDKENQLNEVLHVLENIDSRRNDDWSCKYNNYNGILTQPTVCDSPQVNIEYIDIDETAFESADYTQNQYKIYMSNNSTGCKRLNKTVSNINIEKHKTVMSIERNNKEQAKGNRTHEFVKQVYVSKSKNVNDDNNEFNSLRDNTEPISNCRNLEASRTRIEENITIDSQATEIYSVHGFTDNNVAMDESRNLAVSRNNNQAIDTEATEIYALHGFTETNRSGNKSRNLVASRSSNKENLTFDSQATEIYTVHGFTESNVSGNKSRNSFTSESNNKENLTFDSQATNIYSVHGFTEINESGNKNINLAGTGSRNDKNLTLLATQIFTENEFSENRHFDNNLTNTNDKSRTNTLGSKTRETHTAYTDNDKFNNAQERIPIKDDNKNLDDVLQSDVLTDTYTHLSPSQDNSFAIPHQYITNNNANKKFDDNDKNINDTRKKGLENNNIELISQRNATNIEFIDQIPDEIDSQRIQIENSQINNESADENFIANAQNTSDTQKSLTNDAKSNIINEVSLQKSHSGPEDNVDELTTSQTELIPFKVIEELNRVKNYLNRRMERRTSNDGSIDSGYKSDSQGRTYRNSLQLSGNFVSQSAHCLYDYLTHCPLVASTREITKEISQVLGQLIDRLHAEESYPSFLEELLETINTELNGLYSLDDVLLKKDESIQRLVLLNTSVHILNYSIEKMTDILENIYSSLTSQGEPIELTNITATENIPYIFHALEIILKRYIKSRDISADNSQDLSQDIIFKKSNITDIWRRKWNPNFKEIKCDDNHKSKCVLSKCSDILNKIIVGTMKTYSLAAFSALQCFNLLQ